MSELKMPPKGQGAAMLQELNAEHAPESPLETPQLTNVTTLQGTNDRTNEDTNERTKARTQERRNERTKVSSTEESDEIREAKRIAPTSAQAPEAAASRKVRLARALDRAAEDEIVVVTVRAPVRLNQYMDEYVARINRLDPRRKYRKQDAVLEAFAAFYADHPMPPAPADEIDL